MLRLTSLRTSNGPDVHVYLVAAPNVTDDDVVKHADVVDLGTMKGNLGTRTTPARRHGSLEYSIGEHLVRALRRELRSARLGPA